MFDQLWFLSSKLTIGFVWFLGAVLQRGVELRSLAEAWLLPMRLEKIMVVGADIPHSLNSLLRSCGRNVTHVRDGRRAVLRAEREIFDAAILISTGEEMDLAETVFNLSDINHSMELIIVSDQTPTWESAVSTDTLAGLIPNAVVMSTQNLKKHLTTP